LPQLVSLRLCSTIAASNAKGKIIKTTIMEPTDNPYDILGVPESATARDIRTAYRRLALEHHPDRQQQPSSRAEQNNTMLFAKINHAYEVLTDPDIQRSWQKKDKKNNVQQQQQQQRPPYYYHHDPFSVFESVFRDEFAAAGGYGDLFRGSLHHHHGAFVRDSFPSLFDGRDPFDDPFFRHHNSHHQSSSPWSSRLFRHGDDFFGGGGPGLVDDLFRNTLEEARKNQQHENGPPPTKTKTSFYSSSTLSRRNSQGHWVTETTENRNGKVSTERITRDASTGHIVQRDTIQPNGNTTTNVVKGQPAAEVVATTTADAPTKKNNNNGLFRLPWRRGSDE
jgi:curved DNA-binding protein CbpA